MSQYTLHNLFTELKYEILYHLPEADMINLCQADHSWYPIVKRYIEDHLKDNYSGVELVALGRERCFPTVKLLIASRELKPLEYSAILTGAFDVVNTTLPGSYWPVIRLVEPKIMGLCGYEIFILSGRSGDLDLVRWARNHSVSTNLKFLSKQVLLGAALEGHTINFIEEIMVIYENYDVSSVMTGACANGHLGLAQWALDRSCNTAKLLMKGLTFAICNGNMDSIRWLSTIAPEMMKKEIGERGNSLGYFGYHQVLDYLIQGNYSIPWEDVFKGASRRGNKDMMERAYKELAKETHDVRLRHILLDQALRRVLMSEDKTAAIVFLITTWQELYQNHLIDAFDWNTYLALASSADKDLLLELREKYN